MALQEACWDRFHEFIAEWRRPLGPQDGLPLEDVEQAESRLKVKLPETLRQLYLAAGNRKDLFRSVTRLLKPRELGFAAEDPESEDNGLIFYTESDGAVQWGIRATDLPLHDPPVCIDHSEALIEAWADRRWLQQNSTLSEFIYQTIVMDAAWRGGRRVRYGWASAADYETIIERFEPIDLPSWNWPDEDSRLWKAAGVVAMTGRDLVGDDLVEFVAAGRKKRDVDPVVEGLPVRWEVWD
jgi:hypothetical protein